MRPASAPWNQAPGSASTAWPAAAPKTEGLATAAVVVGIVSLVLFVVGAALGPLAIVFGVAARKRIARDANLRGSGQARAGIILGLIATLGGLAFVIGIIGAEHFW